MKKGTSKTCPKFAFEVGEADGDPDMVALTLTRNGYQHQTDTIPRDAAPAVGLALLSHRTTKEIEGDPAKDWVNLGAQDMLVDCIADVKAAVREVPSSPADLIAGILRRLEDRRDPNVTVRECRSEDIGEFCG